ncbi:hypothetical protein [Streptomyces huasconensis]|uniref:hypothetical protein n=1 Tax=Streptomyces huasconensis TaxID=1854574 RepID=UPI0036F6F360
MKLKELLGMGGGSGPYTVIPVKVWLPILLVGLALRTLLSRLTPLPGWAGWTLASVSWAVGLGTAAVLDERRDRPTS